MYNNNFVLRAFLDTHHIVAQLDIETGQVIFYKISRFQLEMDKSYSIKHLINDYISAGYVAEDDVSKFLYYLNNKNLMEHCLTNQSSVLFSYKLRIQEQIIWCRVIVSVPDDFYKSDSKRILVYQRELPASESDMEISMESWSGRFIKILRYNTTNNELDVIKERKPEVIMREEYLRKNPNAPSWFFEKELIFKEDLQMFLQKIDFSVIEDELSSNRESYSFYYRRRIGNMYKWVRLTIIKSNEYRPYEKVYLFYLEDVHQVLTDIFDKQGLKQYLDLTGYTQDSSDAYYKNTVSILSYFTEKYLDFFMIDLRKNLYILYKINPALMNGSVPYIGSYSELSQQMISSSKNSVDISALSSIASVDHLISLLSTRASIQIIHTTDKGRLAKSTITKIECEDGIPSKAIWCTVPYVSDKQLVVRTFGNFMVFDDEGNRIKFSKKQSKQLLAYLIDKQGYPSSTRDIVQDVLEKDPQDLNAVKYVSTLTRLLIKDLEAHGYVDIIEKEYNTIRINTNQIDCDYYHLLAGDNSYWTSYHNEYMKEYSWAEATNAEILNFYSL